MVINFNEKKTITILNLNMNALLLKTEYFFHILIEFIIDINTTIDELNLVEVCLEIASKKWRN
jgi:hypothetical protein